jgi:hypothetical protein
MSQSKEDGLLVAWTSYNFVKLDRLMPLGLWILHRCCKVVILYQNSVWENATVTLQWLYQVVLKMSMIGWDIMQVGESSINTPLSPSHDLQWQVC